MLQSLCILYFFTFTDFIHTGGVIDIAVFLIKIQLTFSAVLFSTINGEIKITIIE